MVKVDMLGTGDIFRRLFVTRDVFTRYFSWLFRGPHLLGKPLFPGVFLGFSLPSF